MTWSKVANCLSTWAKAFLNKGQGCSNCSDAIITWCVLARVSRIGHYNQTQICPCMCTKIDTALRLKERTEQEAILWLRHLEMILTLGSSFVNFDVGVFIHKRRAHHSLELWTSLSLDRTLSFENVSLLVISSAHKTCLLYTFVCSASQETSAATALWSIFEGYWKKFCVWIHIDFAPLSPYC